MANTQPAPLPWRVETCDDSYNHDLSTVVDASDEWVADFVEPPHAELIVRAVNSHADLLAALKAVTDLLASTRDVQFGNDPEGSDAVDAARAAIEKAEG